MNSLIMFKLLYLSSYILYIVSSTIKCEYNVLKNTRLRQRSIYNNLSEENVNKKAKKKIIIARVFQISSIISLISSFCLDYANSFLFSEKATEWEFIIIMIIALYTIFFNAPIAYYFILKK